MTRRKIASVQNKIEPGGHTVRAGVKRKARWSKRLVQQMINHSPDTIRQILTGGGRSTTDLYQPWSAPQACGSCPTARESHSADVIGGNRVYVFGGWRKGPLNDLYILETDKMTWTQTEFPNVPSERSGVSKDTKTGHWFVILPAYSQTMQCDGF